MWVRSDANAVSARNSVLHAARKALQPKAIGASSVFQLDAFFIRAATGPPRLGEGEPLIRWGKVLLFHDECLAYYSE